MARAKRHRDARYAATLKLEVGHFKTRLRKREKTISTDSQTPEVWSEEKSARAERELAYWKQYAEDADKQMIAAGGATLAIKTKLLDEANAENTRLLAALEFYAAAETYAEDEFTLSKIYFDEGEKAREALNGTNG